MSKKIEVWIYGIGLAFCVYYIVFCVVMDRVGGAL